MSGFKAGDVVECVSEGFTHCDCTEGKLYVVLGVPTAHCGYIDILGDSGSKIIRSSRRFKLKDRMPQLPSPPDFQTQCNEIMDWFQFSKVAEAMQALNWQWIGSESYDGVPSEAELRVEARELLKEVYKNGGGLGTGGLLAENSDGYLSLKFVLADWYID